VSGKKMPTKKIKLAHNKRKPVAVKPSIYFFNSEFISLSTHFQNEIKQSGGRN